MASQEEAIVQKLLQDPMYWDPITHENEGSSVQCVARLKRDLYEFNSKEFDGIYLHQDENNLSKLHVIIGGCDNTPYKCGFFYFIMKFPPSYPDQPPRVRLMTTGNGSVRFNPRFRLDGKVCLSILGTFIGPGQGWTPDKSLTSVLKSIQNIMNGNPYVLESGFEVEKNPDDAHNYFCIIQHETIRVAVCDALEDCLAGRHPCPPPLRQLMMETFDRWYPYYVGILNARRKQDGHRIHDPFGDKRPKCQIKNLLTRLENLKQRVQDRLLNIEGKN